LPIPVVPCKCGLIVPVSKELIDFGRGVLAPFTQLLMEIAATTVDSVYFSASTALLSGISLITRTADPAVDLAGIACGGDRHQRVGKGDVHCPSPATAAAVPPRLPTLQ
jgi:hypothetical protein